MTASWLALCIDAHDPRRYDAMTTFWATATGLVASPVPADHAAEGVAGRLMSADSAGPTDSEDPVVVLMAVPERRATKHRVHLDLRVDSVDELLAAGATVLDERPGRTVLTGPEGGELYASAPEQVSEGSGGRRLHAVVVDAERPEVVARWWAQRLGVAVRDDSEAWWVVGVPGMPFDALVFQPSPEPKTLKNEIHWDVRGDVAELAAAGATVRWEQPQWTTMADPEGNEFCVFPPG